MLKCGATDARLDRQVAIKVLAGALAGGAVVALLLRLFNGSIEIPKRLPTRLTVTLPDGGARRVLTAPEGEWRLGPPVIAGTDTALFFAQNRYSLRIKSIPLDGGEPRSVLEDASQPLTLSSIRRLYVSRPFHSVGRTTAWPETTASLWCAAGCGASRASPGADTTLKALDHGVRAGYEKEAARLANHELMLSGGLLDGREFEGGACEHGGRLPCTVVSDHCCPSPSRWR